MAGDGNIARLPRQGGAGNMADRAAKRPGVERTGDREIALRRATYLEAVRDAWQTAEWTAGEQPEWLK